jgi:hypothetical protein
MQVIIITRALIVVPAKAGTHADASTPARGSDGADATAANSALSRYHPWLERWVSAFAGTTGVGWY